VLEASAAVDEQQPAKIERGSPGGSAAIKAVKEHARLIEVRTVDQPESQAEG
jgi:hypothetical protein